MHAVRVAIVVREWHLWLGPVNLFDFHSDDIVRLNDADLRELVARLCEAERELQGGSRTEVLWGGEQTTPDGGLDVVVRILTSFSPTPIIPRRHTGIQVKRGSMGGAEIAREMRPGGSIRPSIAELAESSGAYLIVSAGDNCSDSMVRRREAAMRAASAELSAATSLHVAFIDRTMLARWVSAHPSPALWVRARLGLPVLAGWHPLGRWSSTPATASDDLICADGLLVHIGRASYKAIPEALDAVRRLAAEGTVNRRANLTPDRRAILTPLVPGRSGPGPTELMMWWRRLGP